MRIHYVRSRKLTHIIWCYLNIYICQVIRLIDRRMAGQPGSLVKRISTCHRHVMHNKIIQLIFFRFQNVGYVNATTISFITNGIGAEFTRASGTNGSRRCKFIGSHWLFVAVSTFIGTCSAAGSIIWNSKWLLWNVQVSWIGIIDGQFCINHIASLYILCKHNRRLHSTSLMLRMIK